MAYICQYFHQGPSHGFVFLWIKETCGTSEIANTAGTPNAVDVVLDAFRHLVIDDVVYAGNVQATRGDWSCDKNGSRASFEVTQRLLTFPLLTIAVQTTRTIQSMCYRDDNNDYSKFIARGSNAKTRVGMLQTWVHN